MGCERDEFDGGWVERQGHLVHLQFDGTRANALTSARYDALACTATGLKADDVWCISAQGPTFSAGQDTAELATAMSDGTLEALLRRGTGAVLALLECRATVVVALSGAAVGGGALVAAAADVVVASPGARVRLPELSLGMPLGASVMERLVGGPASRRLALTGAWADVQELAALGGVEVIGADTDVRELALARCRDLAAIPASVREVARSLFGAGEKARAAQLYAREAAATIAHLR